MGKPTLEYKESLGYQTLDAFFRCYMLERNIEQALSMLSESVYSVGTGEGEVAIGRDAFARLMEAEIAAMPHPISYTIHDYVQQQRLPNCWDCFCHIDTQIQLPDGMHVVYHMRLTAGLHWENDGYLIDVLHASETSKLQDDGEFFPLKFISHGVQTLSRDTRQELMEIISQIMPGGIVGGYVQEGFPLYVANDRLLEMSGYDSYEDFEQDIQGLVINTIHPDDRDYVNSELSGVSQPGDQYELEYRMRRKDGSYFWVYDIGRLTVAADGRLAIISILTDISQKMNTLTHLERAAATDPLTGIYNRKAGKNYMLHLMQAASSYLFLMMDLDNFKLVNDIYGHKQGDQVLCAVADQLTQSFRKSDVVCRLGGDEFAVFIPNCSDIDAIKRKLHLLMGAYHDMMNQHWPDAHSTLSVGGVWGTLPRSFADLYQLADGMLYQVKKGKKGQLRIRALD